MRRVFNSALNKFCVIKPAPISIYKRELPIVYIRLNSTEGKTIFKEALSDGSMQCYFPLAEQFITQAEPETCGPTSLVMVLNSLNVDPGKQWKGIWRWYTEDNLNLITKDILSRGVDLQSWTHLAQHNHLDVVTFYHPKCEGIEQHNDHCDIHSKWVYRTSKYDTFKDCVLSSSRRQGFFLTINHSRKRMQQTGDGHYSPIGGYNKTRNLALMLDVARYKYPSYWCDINKLFDSIQDMDKATNKPRGFVLISRKQQNGGCRTTTNIDFQYISQFYHSIISLSQKLKCDNLNQTDYNTRFIQEFLNIWNDELRSLLVYYLFEFECCNTLSQKKVLFEVLKDHPVYKAILEYEITSKESDYRNNTTNYLKLKSLVNDFTMGNFIEVMTLVIMSLPKSIIRFLDEKEKQKESEKEKEEIILINQNVKLFRKCFVIYREEQKDGKFE